jgi:multicomponent Na+:H+ antiporter subunit A
VPRVRERVVRPVDRLGAAVGPRRVYALWLRGLNRASDRLHDAEVRDLRGSIAAVLVPTGVLVALGVAFTPTSDLFDAGEIAWGDLPTLFLLALTVAAAVAVARDRERFVAVLALSVLGFALGAVYAVAGAPDVALVAVVVETILTLVFVGVLSRLPPTAPTRLASRRRHRRNILAGVLAGGAAFVAIWAALSRPTLAEGDAAEHIELTPSAHGGDVVTVILADFRGFDTLVEITVLAVAVVGVAALLRRGRAW